MCVETSVIRERRRESWVRGVTAWELSRHAGKTQREIAEIFGVATGKAVGAQQDKARRAIQKDRALSRLVRAIELDIEKLERQNS